MQKRSRQLFASLVAATAIAGLVNAAPAQADVKDQCVVEVVGQEADGTFITGPEKCYATYAEVLESRGAKVSPSVKPDTVSRTQLVAASTIATHYDGAGLSGASFSVSGTTCNGGGLNVSLSWNDRISSTSSICGNVTHYENTNYGGSTFVVFGSGNVSGYMDNRTSSIKYF